jgi:hypothetical protein
MNGDGSYTRVERTSGNLTPPSGDVRFQSPVEELILVISEEEATNECCRDCSHTGFRFLRHPNAEVEISESPVLADL